MADDWYETVYENKHEAINDYQAREEYLDCIKPLGL